MVSNDDLLTGVREISAFIRRTPRATYHLLESRDLPAFQIGGRWHARRSTLIKWFEALERQHRQPLDAA